MLRKNSSIRCSAKPKRVRAEDLENVFSMLLLSLPLSEDRNNKRRKKLKSPGGLLSTTPPFSFTTEDAIECMKAMEVMVKNSQTTITISCGVTKISTVYMFLQRFLDAKLVHFPNDRTRNEVDSSNISSNVLLQPTAKGVFFLQRYCKHYGITLDESSNLLNSPFNSMKCIALDRHIVSDNIIHSDLLVHLLFKRFMGPRPNIYSSNSPADNDISPFAHRYFTHPDSDAHTQYYVSHKGVRIFKDYKLNENSKKNSIVIDYCITGKAAVQWLVECVDLVNLKEAIDLGSLFVKHSLLKDVYTQDEHYDTNKKDTLVPSKDALYMLTAKGRTLCDWPWALKRSPSIPKKTLPSISNKPSINITMDSVLQDAGLRLLFREHLSKNCCEENLAFYSELQNFAKKCNKKDNNSAMAVLTYTIYNQFLASGSPYELNIDHKLKEQLIENITQDDSTLCLNLPEIKKLFDLTELHVFKMMEADSLPKFIHSKEFQIGIECLHGT